MDFQSPQNGMYDASNFIDPSAIANNQMNGARQYPMSSVPQKRDSTGAALSRSQTPSQQAQFGFQQSFSHTPSPTLQNQHFRPGQIAPQRMQTASPAQNPHAPQMSPMGFAQGSPMPQGFDPNSGGQFPVQSVSSVQLSQNLQSRQQEAQRQYAMRLQAQQHNLAQSNMAQRQHTGQMPGSAGQHPGMQASMIQSQMQNQQAQVAGQQNFIKNVASLMAQNRRPFNPQPVVANRVIPLQNFYWAVMKLKGWRYVTQTNSWPRIAQMMGIDPQQFPSAPAELQKAYEVNLGVYEQAYLAKQQAMKGAQMQGQMGAMSGMGGQMSPTRPTLPGSQGSPPPSQAYIEQMQRKQAAMAQQQHPNQAMHQQQQFDQALQMQQQQQQHQQMQQQQQLQLQQQQHQQQLRLQQQQQQKLEHSTPVQSNAALATLNGQTTPQTDGKSPKVEAPQHKGSEESYRPSTKTLERYGGLDFSAPNFVNLVDQVLAFRPNMPALAEMGIIDIRALTMSIRSGLHAETRLALDTLSKLTYEQQIALELEKCEDLVDVLVEYAEDQLEILANDNPEVTDILDLTPYEDVIHNCHTEVQALQDLPEFGTKAYDLDRTADRLLAITTILRNLSFLEINHASLSSPSVLKFFSNAVRLVGTRVLLLRSHVNTFDFMKDLITFFSNTSTRIVLPSREDAYTILHFLCAFAPCPRPGVPVRFTPYNAQVHRYLPSAVDSLAKLLARDDPNRTYYKEIFANEATSTPPYDLLTRAFALAISVVPDRTSGRLYQVAETRVSEVRFIEARIAEARKPYLMQGMLAADILASLAPGPDSGVCRSWLESDDGWAASLIKFAMSLAGTDASVQPPQQDHRRPGQRPMDHDVQGFQLIVHRALSTLKRLGDKSKGGEVLVKGVQTNGHADLDDDDDDDMETLDFGGSLWRVKADVFPKKETLLGALLTERLDGRSLRQFCGIGYLDDL